MRNFLLVTKAISNPVRARILKLLEAGELCVCDIILTLGFKQSTISKHINILKNAGLVSDRRDGTWIFYSLSKENINGCNLIIINMMKKCLNEDLNIKKDTDKLKSVKCCLK
jgi:ArsR family transcriptional regulator, arsenate/arsenite/antimonite-responsive transcriptional repressor